MNNHVNNENSLDITYCEYCVNHECIPSDTIYKVELEERDYNINCDCPNKQDHKRNGKCIKAHVCANHKTKEGRGMIMTCDMGICQNCQDYTASGCIKYCDSCSYNLQTCKYCGK